MEQSEFDELLAHARQVAQILKTVFNDLTEEELDLEAGIRHSPLVAVGLAVGAGAVAGWWLGRRQRPALPPPAEEPPAPSSALAYLEHVFPSMEKMRKAVPDSVTDEAAAMARNWMDTVVEPKLKQGMDTLSANMAESKWAVLLKQAMQKMDSEEDVHLDDPPEK